MPTPGAEWPVAASPTPCAAADELMQGVERFGKTYALVAIRDGEVVYEAYGEGKTAASTSVSWSMAKSWLHALVGVAIRRGVLPADLDRPVREFWPRCPPEWADDARAGITMGHLLQMRPNLQWREDYVDGGESDVIPMLAGYASPKANPEGEGPIWQTLEVDKDEGPAPAHSPPGERCGDSMGVWTANMPATGDAPGAKFNYSSGFSNLVSDILTTALCPDGGAAERKAAMLSFFEDHLAGPLGCGGRLQPKFDASGTFVGSSWLYGTALDFARLPFLYLLDGVWGGVRVLPEGWAEYACTISAAEEEEGGPKCEHRALSWPVGKAPSLTST